MAEKRLLRPNLQLQTRLRGKVRSAARLPAYLKPLSPRRATFLPHSSTSTSSSNFELLPPRSRGSSICYFKSNAVKLSNIQACSFSLLKLQGLHTFLSGTSPGCSSGSECDSLTIPFTFGLCSLYVGFWNGYRPWQQHLYPLMGSAPARDAGTFRDAINRVESFFFRSTTREPSVTPSTE